MKMAGYLRLLLQRAGRSVSLQAARAQTQACLRRLPALDRGIGDTDGVQYATARRLHFKSRPTTPYSPASELLGRLTHGNVVSFTDEVLNVALAMDSTQDSILLNLFPPSI